MSYVDFYLLSVPEQNIETYRTMASKAGAVWKDHGAIAYKECVIDDDGHEGLSSLAGMAGSKPGEKTIAAFVIFNSRAERDEINAKVMADPRLADSCDPNNMPFDCSRMAFAGSTPLVDL